MKVTAITPLKNKQGQDVWMVKLEGTEKPLWLGYAPSFEIDDDVPEGDIQLSKNGQSYILKRKTEQATKSQSTWKPVKNDDDILLSVAFKGAIELERHHIVPEGKINTVRVIQTTSEIFAGLVLMRPKRSE